MNQREEAKAAKKFAEKWKDKGDEKQDTSKFWIELLEEVFGVKKVAQSNYLLFEKPVESKNKTTNKKTKKYIDVWIPATKTLIEQKSIGVDLTVPYGQGDGEKLTPFYQAKRYADDLPLAEDARLFKKNQFCDYMKDVQPGDFRDKLLKLYFLIPPQEVAIFSPRATSVFATLKTILCESYTTSKRKGGFYHLRN